MSIIYLAADQESLAEQLLQQLQTRNDFFAPATIVVPNSFVGKWLKLWIAEHHGIAINLRFLSLDDALWTLLRATDTRESRVPPTPVDNVVTQLLALSVLWDDNDSPATASLRRYVDYGGGERSRSYCRRAWQLAERLASLLREYELHRTDEVIAHWNQDRAAFADTQESVHRAEECQRAVWRRIAHELKNSSVTNGESWMTLPEYASEIIHQSPKVDLPPLPETHFFGFSYFAPLHIQILRWMGKAGDLRFYQLDLFPDSGSILSELNDLGKVQRTGRRMMSCLDFPAQQAPATQTHAERPTVLARLQQILTGRPSTGSRKLRQDASVQIAACPSIDREAETVYNTVLHLLQTDSSLNQTDVLVLATDMDRYRPALQAVFDRQQRLSYNLSDFAAADVSLFGQALLDIIDLALESFTRSRVFGVVLNPCFLAALGVERAQASDWLEWVERLGVYHGWNRDDRENRGYGNSPIYSWQWGLRRLRLGQLIDGQTTDAPRFENLIPFTDAIADRENLDAFCRAVEELLPMLTRWRRREATGGQWANDIRQLISRFLEVPEDRGEENQVRDFLLEQLNRLHILGERRLPLAFIREFLHSGMQSLYGNRGEPLVSGVSIAGLKPMRAIPFRVIFIVGLSEDLFPGPNYLAAFDLRSQKQLETDMGPADRNRSALLEMVMSARDKIYLLYTHRDLQKDQQLQPSGPLADLQRFIEDKILVESMKSVDVPLSGSDWSYIDENKRAKHCDVLVNFRESERLIAIEEAVKAGAAKLNTRQKKELSRRQQTSDFSVSRESEEAKKEPETVTLRELSGFLRCPATAAWRRHLRIRDDEDSELDDDEPFRMSYPHNYRIVNVFLDRFVQRSIETSLDEAIGNWPRDFDRFYDEWQESGLAPEDAFGDVDREVFAEQLREQLDPHGELAAMLAARPSDEFCGPAAIGPSLHPIGANIRFPALDIFGDGTTQIVGDTPFVWRNDAALEILVFSHKKKDDKTVCQLSRHLFEPILFYLTLLYGTENATIGSASREWIADRPLQLHLACRNGVATFVYDSISAEGAKLYLTDLVRSFLDAASYDLLPFELIVANENLRAAYTDSDDAQAAQHYPEMLRDEFAFDQEGMHAEYRRPTFFDIVEPAIPADAWQKIRSRFQLLDMGPTKNR